MTSSSVTSSLNAALSVKLPNIEDSASKTLTLIGVATFNSASKVLSIQSQISRMNLPPFKSFGVNYITITQVYLF